MDTALHGHLLHHVLRHVPDLPGLPEKDLYFLLFLRSFLIGYFLLPEIGLRRFYFFPAALQHGRHDGTGDLIRPQNLLQACGQLLLQIDGVELPYIHGLDLNVQFVLPLKLMPFGCGILPVAAVPVFLHTVGAFFLRHDAVFPGLLPLIVSFLLLLLRLRNLFLHSLLLIITVEAMVIGLLLDRGQRLMQHFQLHGLHHIFPLAKPQNQLIAFLHASGCQPHPMIEIGQLIGPLFPIVPFLQLFKDADTLLKAHILRFINFVLQNVAPRISGRCLHEFFIKIYRLHEILGLDAQLAERIADRSSPRPSFISQQQHVLRIIIPSVDLIQITDGTEHHNALHPPPVDGIRYLSRLCEVALRYQPVYFIRPYLIFIFIQSIPLPSLA